MICSWCDGTARCRSSDEKCEHCQGGHVKNPPCGPMTLSYCSELDILGSKDFKIIIDYDKRNIYQQIPFVAEYLGFPNILKEDELKMFKDYWDDEYRGENLGKFLNRVAWFVKQKITFLQSS